MASPAFFGGVQHSAAQRSTAQHIFVTFTVERTKERESRKKEKERRRLAKNRAALCGKNNSKKLAQKWNYTRSDGKTAAALRGEANNPVNKTPPPPSPLFSLYVPPHPYPPSPPGRRRMCTQAGDIKRRFAPRSHDKPTSGKLTAPPSGEHRRLFLLVRPTALPQTKRVSSQKKTSLGLAPRKSIGKMIQSQNPTYTS